MCPSLLSMRVLYRSRLSLATPTLAEKISITASLTISSRNSSAKTKKVGIFPPALNSIRANYSIDIFSNPRALRRLRTACERAKCALTSATQTSIEIDSLFEGIDFYTSITRARFEKICQDLSRNILEPVEKVLRDSKIDKANIHEIVLVGGSTRIPRIVKLISDYFNGKKPNMSVDRDESVAYGAAVLAAIQSGVVSEKTEDFVCLDVAPFSLGIETADGIMTTIIKRNSVIPIKVSEVFSLTPDSKLKMLSYSHDQPSVLIKVFEGERARTKDNNLLCEFGLDLSDIPSASRAALRIEITFDIDSSKLLRATASNTKAGRSNHWHSIIINNGLTKEEIDRMVIDAKKYKGKIMIPAFNIFTRY